MDIAKDKVVSIDYTLRNGEGEVLDTSDGRGPLAYLHGRGGLIPGLERELTGKGIGAELNVVVEPAEAYGERDESLVGKVSRDQFQPGTDLKPGVQFQAQTTQGNRILTVTKVADDHVEVDGNHPLAGQTLHFDVKVVGIRVATAEEVEHGHVHE
jgi:FKBP-type peptidyl-prolyl cis-trans isomerase SlyD